MNRLVRSLTYANVCATLALFIAVSTGGAYAKATLIDGRSIKPNSIPATALMNNSVTSTKIKNGQVTAADVKQGSLTPTVFTAGVQRTLASVPAPDTGTTPDGPHVAGQACKATPAHATRLNLVGAVGVWENATNNPNGVATPALHCVFYADGAEYQRIMLETAAQNA